MKIVVAVKQGATLINSSNSRRQSQCGAGLSLSAI